MRDRDVDSDEGLCTLRRYEQRLERRKKTASNRVGAPGLALTAHRARNRGAPGDGQRLPEGSRYRGATTQGLGTAGASKTGQRGITGVGVELSEVPPKPASEVTTGSEPESAAVNRNINPENIYLRTRER